MIGNLSSKVIDKVNNKIVVTQNLADSIAIKCPKQPGGPRVKFQDITCETERAVKGHIVHPALVCNMEARRCEEVIIRE